MSASRSDSGPEPRVVVDAVRGLRLLREDALGRLVELVRADGDPLRIEYGETGAVRRLDAGDVSIETELRPSRHPVLRVADDHGRTDVDVTGDGWWIARDGAELRLDKDSRGRPESIRIPGSPLPLEFSYSPRGCVISYGGRTLARLGLVDWTTESRRRWRIGPALLEEHREPTRWSLSARTRARGDRGRHVMVWTDLLGRTLRRNADDGFDERFRRDAEGRLAEHHYGVPGDSVTERQFRYDAGELVETRGPDGHTVREHDRGGRILALDRPDGARIRYEYDARGRRTLRHAPEGTTRYAYDGLDRLVRVQRPDGGSVEYTYDGLGRRIGRRDASGARVEHRDASGRLWAVSDPSGRTLETYVWFEDRPLLRFDGALDSPRCTAYLCDPLGTPLLAASIDGRRVVRIERLDAPLYGRVDGEGHPTLFGHFADAAAGLVHFGARDLDPETGAFLTPDPWHGGADDERRWGGAAPGSPDWIEEHAVGERHAYAACGHDPAGRADYDGHVSGGAIAAAIFRGLGNLILGPTWGMPLTSISLFFFLPFNIWAEIVAGIVAIFIQRHPWKNHDLFGGPGLQGSLRQGQLSFALNGFLPRVISGGGITADRAVTIGNCIWISRHELKVLDRHMTVEVSDLASPAPFNQDQGKVSLVALEVADKESKVQIHTTYWTRGYGNTVKTVGAPPRLAFDDRPVDGKRPGTMLLAHPVPFGYDPPAKTDAKEKLNIREFLHDAAAAPPALTSTATILEDVWFALKLSQNKKEKLKADNAIEIEAEAVTDPAQMVIGKVQDTSDFSLLFLFGELPARFKTANVSKDMTVWRIVDDTSRKTTEGWEDAGSAKALEASDPGKGSGKPWPPPLEAKDLVKIKASAPAAPIATVGFPSPPSRDTVHVRVKKLVATLDVADALPAGLGADTSVVLVNGTGSVQNAKLKDVAKDSEIEFTADPDDISQGDRVSVRISGAAAESYARIATLNGKVATLTYLAAKPAYGGPSDLQVRKLVDRTGDDDPKGKAASPTGTSFAVDVPRLASFTADALVHLTSGNNEAIRKIDKMSKARIELADDVLGTKPFTVSPAKRDPDLCRIKQVERPAMRRFLKHTTGADPGTYGKYPDFALEVSPDLAHHMLSKFFVREAANLRDGYHLTWSPIEFNGSKFFVLDNDLPIIDDIKNPGQFAWVYDPDDPDYHAFNWLNIGAKPAGGFVVTLREHKKSGVERPNATAHSPEVCVPADPQFTYSWGDALSEHELHHTLQGNYYGPFLGAFPLQAAILSVTDLVELNDDVDTPSWFRDISSEAMGGNIGLSAWQTFSIGGLMFFAWKFLFLWPGLFADDSRDTLVKSNFASWNRLFNPFWGNLIHKFPNIDPNLSQRNSDAGEVIARLIARAMDLRSWTPFLGLVPTWLPDGPQNFIEQGASRMSGDLYSTILSTDDEFNAKLSMRIGDSLVADDHDADIEKPLGSAFRVMTYPGGRDHRVFQFDRADQPAEPSTVLYNTQFFTRPLVSIEAPADTLFHPDLYELPPGAATLSIEGPTSNPAAVDFLKLAGGSAAQPRLRNLIPLPPRVNRTGGMYFIASQPAVYKCTTFDRHAGQPDDALTQTVSLTVSGTVKLGDDVVQWQTPTAHPGVPAAPKFERFVTEKAVLTLRNHKDKAVATAGYEHRLDIPVGAAAKAAINPASEQWEIIVGDSAATLRIRLYRVFKKNDFADDTKNDPAFDLVYDSVGSLKNVRSYLDKDVWVPVRDFLIEVKPLPALGNQTAKYDSHVDVPLPLTVAASAIVITPPAGAPRMDTPDDRGKDPNPANKRGQIWRFGPLGKVVEDAAVYKVEVTFGDPATVSQKAGFDLTIEPIIRLTAGGAFEASKGSPLELTINDGTPAFSLDTDNLPAGSAAQLDSPNRKVTITVNDAPAAATKAVITITDSQGKKGQRTVTVK